MIWALALASLSNVRARFQPCRNRQPQKNCHPEPARALCERRGGTAFAPPRPRSPDHRPNVGGVPQSHNFCHPHFANQAKLAAISDTFKIGVTYVAFIA